MLPLLRPATLAAITAHSRSGHLYSLAIRSIKNDSRQRLLRQSRSTASVTVSRQSKRFTSTTPHSTASSSDRPAPDSSVSNSSNSSGEEETPLIPNPIPTPIVSDYWDDVMKYSHEPESYTLGHPPDTCTINEPHQPLHRYRSDTSIRKLLDGATRAGAGAVADRGVRNGDLMPKVLAKEVCAVYETMSMPERAKFLTILARDFGIDRNRVLKASKLFQDSCQNQKRASGEGGEASTVLEERSVLKAEKMLRDALKPRFEALFDQIYLLPGGMQFLVHLREDLLKIINETPHLSTSHLHTLNTSLRTLLQSWFSTNFIDLERITWNSPATILEKIAKYEAVHPVQNWQALKQRLGVNRLCFAFLHRGMPLEPLTFVK
ncbi:hypothetical protein HK102_010293, partial [Quaeritorhiza haematococci]